jgi:hypothetical protein
MILRIYLLISIIYLLAIRLCSCSAFPNNLMLSQLHIFYALVVEIEPLFSREYVSTRPLSFRYLYRKRSGVF